MIVDRVEMSDLIYNMNRVNFFLYALCKSGMD